MSSQSVLVPEERLVKRDGEEAILMGAPGVCGPSSVNVEFRRQKSV